MSYRIEIHRDAEKEMNAFPAKDVRRIHEKIVTLADNPLPPKSAKLQGSRERYRVRSGDYRIIYKIDDKQQLVTILRIGHRKEVYR